MGGSPTGSLSRPIQGPDLLGGMDIGRVFRVASRNSMNTSFRTALAGLSLLTLLHEMKRRNLKLGLAALCVGGGQGAAFVLERP